MNVSLKCECGAMQGMAVGVSKDTGYRAVCYCDDCQAYAHYLGKANSVLDSSGGTDVFPVAPASLKITKGAENLKCMRLSNKGMYRWFAGCCKTPIANSIFANSMPYYKVPFAGVIHVIMNHAADNMTREQAVGPIRSRFQGKFGIPPLPEGTVSTPPLGMIVHTIGFLFVGFIKGRFKPSPFFDEQGEPRVEPVVLTPAERDLLRPLCGPNPTKKS